MIDTVNRNVTREWISQEGEGAILRLEWDEPKTVKWLNFTITEGVADKTTTTNVESGERLGISEIQVVEAE